MYYEIDTAVLTFYVNSWAGKWLNLFFLAYYANMMRELKLLLCLIALVIFIVFFQCLP